MFGGDDNDTLDGGTGADTMAGGAGNDIYFVDSNADVVMENAGEGTDKVYSSIASYTLSAGVENLVLQAGAISGTGTGEANTIIVDDLNSANVSLFGMDGKDKLTGGTGNDSLDGGAGNDTLAGGAGADTVTGGTGNDRFVFNFADIATGATHDSIADFTHANDKIDLSDIDAITGSAGSSFTFIGAGVFTHTAGELHYVVNPGGGVILQGDLNGDGVEDFNIDVHGAASLVASDIIV